MIVADLSTWDESWVAYFDDVDTVVHLAGNPDDDAPWDALVGPNLDGLANVFHASAFGGVERVIFASSNHVMGRYRDIGDMPITVDLPPRPDGPYGGTKLVGERLGRSLASAFDLTFIAIRIGWVQRGRTGRRPCQTTGRAACGSLTTTSSTCSKPRSRPTWASGRSWSSTACRTTAACAGT